MQHVMQYKRSLKRMSKTPDEDGRDIGYYVQGLDAYIVNAYKKEK